jgi:hypothetical protein
MLTLLGKGCKDSSAKFGISSAADFAATFIPAPTATQYSVDAFLCITYFSNHSILLLSYNERWAKANISAQ